MFISHWVLPSSLKACPHRRFRQSRTVWQSRMRLCSTPSTQVLATKAYVTKPQAACDKVTWLSTWQQAPVWTAVQQSSTVSMRQSRTMRICCKLLCGQGFSICQVRKIYQNVYLHIYIMWQYIEFTNWNACSTYRHLKMDLTLEWVASLDSVV